MTHFPLASTHSSYMGLINFFLSCVGCVYKLRLKMIFPAISNIYLDLGCCPYFLKSMNACWTLMPGRYMLIHSTIFFDILYIIYYFYRYCLKIVLNFFLEKKNYNDKVLRRIDPHTYEENGKWHTLKQRNRHKIFLTPIRYLKFEACLST